MSKPIVERRTENEFVSEERIAEPACMAILMCAGVAISDGREAARQRCSRRFLLRKVAIGSRHRAVHYLRAETYTLPPLSVIPELSQNCD